MDEERQKITKNLCSHPASPYHGMQPSWLIRHGQVIYSPSNKIGSGNFCDVYKGKFNNQQRNLVNAAIKVNSNVLKICVIQLFWVCHQETENNNQEAPEAKKAMLREAKIMSQYCHPNVIEFFGVTYDHPPTLLLMEYCRGGSLEDLLRRDHAIPEHELLLYCFEVSRGMRYLHLQNCIHRDLATRNCLISSVGVIKISDFGLSKIFGERQLKEDSIMKRIPIRWMAPECISKTPVYSFASDLWAFGVLVYEIFNKGIAPWPEDSDFKAMGKRIRAFDMPKLPEGTPEFMVKLVEERIWKEAEIRPTFKEILVILADYLFANLHLFPGPRQMHISSMPYIFRDYIVQTTKLDLLIDEKELKSPVYHKPRLARTPQKRNRSRAKSVGSVTSLASAGRSNMSRENVQQASQQKRRSYAVGKSKNKSMANKNNRSVND